MKLTYLGTAAAEGWPAVFCRCEHCLRAQNAGGRNIRTRSQAIINDDLLIDFPGDSNSHMLSNKLDFSAVKYLLVTHSHLDHFVPTDLHFRSLSYYAHNMTTPTLQIYGNERVIKVFGDEIKYYPDEPDETGITAAVAKAYQTITLGKYRATPLPAYHAEGENAFVWLITDGEKTVLYLHDTGHLFDEVYDYLKENKVYADLVSYDCTYGALKSGGGHLGLDSDPIVREKLESIGVSDKNTISVTNHFSHNGGLIYDELVPVAEKAGFVTAYDGLSITL